MDPKDNNNKYILRVEYDNKMMELEHQISSLNSFFKAIKDTLDNNSMANNNTPQFKTYRHSGFELLVEVVEGGRYILRKIKILSRHRTELELPSDGSGIEILPENVVGTEQIKDEGVKKNDLEKDIQDKLDVLDDSNVMTEEEIEEEWQQAMQNAGLNLNNG